MVRLPRFVFWIALLFCLPTLAFSAPQYAAEADGARIVLHDEPCALKGVSNLRYRATWAEKGKVFEGCWGPRPQEGLVLGFFEDLTVVAIPIQMFAKVVGV